MENMAVDPSFWLNKKILVTGHTGFKGSWLTLWLSSLGADVFGYSLPPSEGPCLFNIARVSEKVESQFDDLADLSVLRKFVEQVEPEIVFHLAAQSLLPYSYNHPVETYRTNVLGTVHLFEALRSCNSLKAIVNVTSDKCYENVHKNEGYIESDRLGGYDPYSNSKACAEFVANAYRNSFFNDLGVSVASVRAGNVIGGGDWASNRLIPDIIRAAIESKPVEIRNPNAVRPWQHVLEPLSGYISLAEHLFNDEEYSGAWNFGPREQDARQVADVLGIAKNTWPDKIKFNLVENSEIGHEATLLKLDISKAVERLPWKPVWDLNTAVIRSIKWYDNFLKNHDMQLYSYKEIEEFSSQVSDASIS